MISTSSARPTPTSTDPLDPARPRFVPAGRRPGPDQRFGRHLFTGRLVAPRSFRPDRPPEEFVTAPGRFHLYTGHSSPLAHRSALVIALTGLEDVVSGSDVETADGEPRDDGVPDLRDAYTVTDPEFAGAVTVPTLWDRDTHQVVSNHYPTLEIDLATEFREWSATGRELYPVALRAEIDALDRWLGPVVDQGPSRPAGAGGPAGRAARSRLNEAFAVLDRRLARARFLLGDRLTLADVRLWVTLVRYGANDLGEHRISLELSPFGSLWAYAQGLFEMDAFRSTTGSAASPEWRFHHGFAQ